MLDRLFRLHENGTTVRTELLAGLTTFLTMSYIIFVQPAVLSGQLVGVDTGMDFGAVTVATCLAAALATALMGWYARYPVAQAPGMGQNFFFVFSIIPAAAAAGHPEPWRAALGVIFVSGVLFLALSVLGLTGLAAGLVTSAIAAGLGAKGARHVMTRADLLALDVAVHLAESYRRRYLERTCPPRQLPLPGFDAADLTPREAADGATADTPSDVPLLRAA